MATNEIKAIEWTCNGCDRSVLVIAGDPKPDGFHIPVVQAWGKGRASAPAEVWACKAGCIRKGVENALQDAAAQDDELARQDEVTGR